MLRLVISLLVNKLNIVKTIKNWKGIFRFTAACSLFTMIYHLCRRVMRQYKSKNFKICRDLEVTIACGLASLGLHVATPGDMGIFKIILFSRAIGALVKIVGNETGMYRPVEEPLNDEKRTWTVEAILTVTFCVYITYAYIFRPQYMDLSFYNGFASLVDF